MQLFNIPIAFYLTFVNLHLLSSHPVPSEIVSSEDIDILKVLLRRLEESIPEQAPVSSDHFPAQRDANVLVDDTSLAEEDYNQPQNVQQPSLSLADVKDFLSARDLKAVRSDSPKRYSACFGRRMDRIGSMTSLGCNTIGRSNRKRR